MYKLYENVDYIFQPDESVDARQFDCIRFVKPPYKDIVVRVGMLKFSGKQNRDGSLSVKFDYEVVSAPSGLDEAALQDDRKFSRLLGDTLITILEDQISEKEPDDREYKVRDVNPEEVED